MTKKLLILCFFLIFQSCKQEPEIKITNQSTSLIDSIAIVSFGENKEFFIRLNPGETKSYPLEQSYFGDNMYTVSYLQNDKAREATFSFYQYSVGVGNSTESEYLITIESDTVKTNFSRPD